LFVFIFHKGFLILTVSRYSLLHDWLCDFFKCSSINLTALTGDAGFRKYYRFEHQGQTYIAVDATPEMSNNLAFVTLQKAFEKKNLMVPDILSVDLSKGFFCLSDFGDVLFSDILSPDNMEQEYKKAIAELPKIADITLDDSYELPEYDGDFVRVELHIFIEWLLAKHLNIMLTTQESSALQQCFDVLVKNIEAQPKVTMHRDYHCRNLMVLAQGANKQCNDTCQLGIIDFQDAVNGPITYDIVSLLRDCYVKWPKQSVDNLFQYYRELMTSQDRYSDVSEQEWRRWFDLTGIQRHVKASGIFARLYHRDGKSGYLKDIPLTLSYIVDICQQYPELKALQDIVSNKVIPAITLLEAE